MADALVFERVSKHFQRPHERVTTVKSALMRTLMRRTGFDEFWALRDVSLRVGQGEAFGVIGPNGSGKSTLLSLAARVLRPTSGRVTTVGRLVAMLEVGVGFHPELTGRENVFLSAALFGLSRAEIRRRYDDIVAFAEIEEFMDAPVKTYSTGMLTRIGFAVAVNVDADVLLVDEVLSVGDEHFQRKCLAKVHEVIGAGKTILFVSHALDTVRNVCSRAAWLQDGVIQAEGPSGAVIDSYLQSVS
jgi:ABC-type polysaccharide/polyol phosphate transport system ATPase subunit